MSRYRVGLIGAGGVGARRAEIVAQDARCTLVAVADVNLERARAVAEKFGVESCVVTDAAQAVIDNPQLDIVIVSTPNDGIAPYSIAALRAGKHVLCEKPPGRNLQEAREIADAALTARGVFKIGFNHRYYPGLIEAQRLVRAGEIGEPMWVRSVYGHGGRPGYEKEWRMTKEISGGGQLVDQGVHTIDLAQWFLGDIARVMAHLPTYFYPTELEDNSFLWMWTPQRQMMHCHLSITEWRNRFEFEVFGKDGYVRVQGLAKSYGPQRLTLGCRAPQGGVPTEQVWEYPNEDPTWRLEWEDVLGRIARGASNEDTATQGIKVMEVLAAAYESARVGAVVGVGD